VQRAAHPSQRAGLFALIVGSSSLAIALGAALAAPLTALVSTRGAFVAAGGLVVLVAAPLAVVLARADPTGLAAASMTAADSAAGRSRGTGGGAVAPAAASNGSGAVEREPDLLRALPERQAPELP
jgi:predicted MFS family arabinose efflux permease